MIQALGRFVATGAVVDLPAILITVALTAILVRGIRESASFNTVMVVVKLAVVLMVIGVGAFYVDPANWHPFAPFGYSGLSLFGKTILGQTGAGGEPLGMLAGSAIIFFAYIGFDSVSTHAEEARNPSRDIPIGILGSLAICTVLYIAVAAVLTGMVPYDQINIDAPVADAFRQVGLPWAHFVVSIGAVVGITSVLLVLMLSQPRVMLAMARDGLVSPAFLWRGASPVPHAVDLPDPDGLHCRRAGGVSAAAHPGRTGQHRDPAGLLSWSVPRCWCCAGPIRMRDGASACRWFLWCRSWAWAVRCSSCSRCRRKTGGGCSSGCWPGLSSIFSTAGGTACCVPSRRSLRCPGKVRNLSDFVLHVPDQNGCAILRKNEHAPGSSLENRAAAASGSRGPWIRSGRACPSDARTVPMFQFPLTFSTGAARRLAACWQSPTGC